MEPCQICYSVPRSPHIFNCGHGACATCIVASLKQRECCFLCRAKIERVIPVYMYSGETDAESIAASGEILLWNSEHTVDDSASEEQRLHSSCLALKSINWTELAPASRTERVAIGLLYLGLIDLDELTEEERTEGVYFAMIEEDEIMLNFVPEEKRSLRICETAMNNTVQAFEYVPTELRTSSMALRSCIADASLIEFVPESFLTPPFFHKLFSSSPTTMLELASLPHVLALTEHDFSMVLTLIEEDSRAIAFSYFPTKMRTLSVLEEHHAVISDVIHLLPRAERLKAWALEASDSVASFLPLGDVENILTSGDSLENEEVESTDT